MTQPAGTAAPRHEVVIVGAGAAGLCAASKLLEAGVTDFVILEKADDICPTWPSALRDQIRLGRDVISSVFDDDSDSWTLHTRGGETFHAHVAIAACGPMYVPWIPDLCGQNDFRGVSFHSAASDRDFDAAGKRIAVVGGDALTGTFIDRLTTSAASVEVFAHPPRRIISAVPSRRAAATRWLRRQVPGTRRRPAPESVRTPIDTVTASGIRTCDGVDHDVDVIIYGTGFAIPETVPAETLVGAGGLTLRQGWHDGMEPYLGVAVYGFPNYFFVTRCDAEVQAHDVVECLRNMKQTFSTRIEVRRSSQQVFNERVHLGRPLRHPVRQGFDLSSSDHRHDETYDGPAKLTIGGTCRQVCVRLTGHVDPIDGQYHWRGTIFDQLPADVLQRARAVTLAVGERTAPARLAEQTPWGTHSVVGVGAPPFAVDDIELAVPQA